MAKTVISVEHLYKEYKLGVISHGTLYRDMQSWWARIRGKEDPNSLISQHHKKFAEKGSFLALNDVSFKVKEGEILGIIGRNGAGKSTLLKILSRITAPTSGQIKLRGRVGALLEVGTGFHPELTGRENIYLNGAILGMKKWEIKKKLDEIIDFAGIEKHIDTPVKRYSSGMYVRLAFSVAAHLEPEILVVDEVLTVGDVEFQKKCLGKMHDVADVGKTVLFVSHNFASLKALCNKGILLDEGKVLIQDSLVKVVDKYSTLIALSDKVFSPLIADSAVILSIHLCDVNNRVLNHIDTDTEIYVTLKYKVTAVKQVNMTINLSKDGQIIFQSINNFDPQFYTKKEPGMYQSICKIPKQFLNNGQFMLSITVFEENYSNPKDFRDVISFMVEDAPSVRGDYFGGLLGSVRPKLEWVTLKYE